MEKHLPNLLAAGWVLAFFASAFAVSRLVRPARPTPDAKADERPEPKRGPWIRMSARHHILVVAAAMFFAFTLLLFPAMSSLRQRQEAGFGGGALAAIGVFLGIMYVALVYAAKKRDLTWVDGAENE